MRSPYTRKLLQLSIPILGTSALQMAYNFTDMIWVGRLGGGAVTSVGTAGLLANFFWALASILTVGTTIRLSQAIGAKDAKAIGNYKTTALYSILTMAVLCSIILYSCSPHLIHFFRLNDPQTIRDAIAYNRVDSINLLFTFFNLFAVSVFNAYGKTNLSFRILMLGTLANVALDPLMIYGLHFGVVGAAYATLLSRVCVGLYAIQIFLSHSTIRFTVKKFCHKTFTSLIKVGAPTAIQRVMFTCISMVLARIIVQWGDDAIAVQKIGIQLEAFTYMIVGGLMQATVIFVGQSYGAKKYDRLKRIYRSALWVALIIGSFNTLLYLTIPESLYRIMTVDPHIIAMGKYYLMILGASQLFMCLEMIAGGFFQGLGKTHIPGIISVIFTSMRIPLALWLGATNLGLTGVWWSISISSFIKGIIATACIIYFFSIQYHKYYGSNKPTIRQALKRT